MQQTLNTSAKMYDRRESESKFQILQDNQYRTDESELRKNAENQRKFKVGVHKTTQHCGLILTRTSRFYFPRKSLCLDWRQINLLHHHNKILVPIAEPLRELKTFRPWAFSHSLLIARPRTELTRVLVWRERRLKLNLGVLMHEDLSRHSLRIFGLKLGFTYTITHQPFWRHCIGTVYLAAWIYPQGLNDVTTSPVFNFVIFFDDDFVCCSLPITYTFMCLCYLICNDLWRMIGVGQPMPAL